MSDGAQGGGHMTRSLGDDCLRVYIAGPYAGGKWGTNIRNAIEAAERVYQAGHAPFIPHTMNGLWSILHEKDKEEWLDIDLAYLGQCDCMIRLPGESPGSDVEVAYAEEKGISVFWSVDEFESEVVAHV